MGMYLTLWPLNVRQDYDKLFFLRFIEHDIGACFSVNIKHIYYLH